MASIRKYTTAKGAAWRVQYRSPDGKSRTKQPFSTKGAAEAWAAKNTVDIHTQQWVSSEMTRRTVCDYKNKFFTTKAHLAEGSLVSMRRSWNNWVEPSWGHRKISSIRTSEVQAWLSKHANQASTIRRAHGILAGIIDIAMEDGCVNKNHARGVTLPSKPSPKHVYLTASQLTRLAEECREWGPMVMLLGTTGMRWSEMAGLQAGDIPDIGSRVQLTRAAKWVDRTLHVGELKTHEGRTISLSSQSMAYLRSLAKGQSSDAWLFTDSDGQPMRQLDHHSRFHMAVNRLVKSGDLPKRVTPHGLRHVAAGLMISSNTNVKAVQRQLGHKSAAMTLDVYADLFDTDLDQVGRAMDALVTNVVQLSCDSPDSV